MSNQLTEATVTLGPGESFEVPIIVYKGCVLVWDFHLDGKCGVLGGIRFRLVGYYLFTIVLANVSF